MLPLLQKIYQTNKVEDEAGNSFPLNSETSIREGEFLQQIIRETEAKITLETGMAYGVSSLWICEALRENNGIKHIAIDPAQRIVPSDDQNQSTKPADSGWCGIGASNLKKAEFGDLLELHTHSSHQALPLLESRGERIDFAFIDGMHTFDYAFIDFFYIDRILKPGGVIVFDDLCIPAVNKVFRYALTNRAYELYIQEKEKAQLSRIKRMILGIPIFGKKIKNLVKPEFLLPDYMIGISNRFYGAIRKTRDDFISDGATMKSRNWDHYEEF